MMAAAVLAGIANGNIQAVSAAALSGASSAVELCLAIAGPICLWSGVMELSRECGGSALLGRLLKAPLASLFTSVKDIPEVMNKISANISANILGLGNAATPLGMAAAAELGKRCVNGKASKELCNLVVINTASLQIVPATVAAVRAALGCPAPLDILPAVWISGAAALTVGLTVSALCERLSRLSSRRIR
jgi:spore maturation protein A